MCERDESEKNGGRILSCVRLFQKSIQFGHRINTVLSKKTHSIINNISQNATILFFIKSSCRWNNKRKGVVDFYGKIGDNETKSTYFTEHGMRTVMVFLYASDREGGRYDELEHGLSRNFGKSG